MNSKGYATVFLISLWALALASARARAQRPEADLTVPGEEHKKLDSLSGTWEVIVNYVVSPGKEQEGKATCDAKWALDGRFLRQEYSSTIAGKPFTVVQYLGFDRHKGKFVELYMNSMDTGAMCNEGTVSKDGKTITCSGKRADPATHKEGKIRTVTTIENKDSYTLEWYFTDADGKETKAVTLNHQRKKAQ